MTITSRGGAEFSDSVNRYLVEGFYGGICKNHGFSCLDSLNLFRLAFGAFSNIIKNVIPHAGPIIPLPYLLIGLVYPLVPSYQAVVKGVNNLVFFFRDGKYACP